MLNWFDLMRQAQSSTGFDLLTQQFKLSDDQAQKALLALLPAFAMGMQRLMLTAPSNPLFQSLSANPWLTTGADFSSQARQNGKRVIDGLFGSDEASRRIAHMAADFTGLSVDIMQQMLPVMAGIFAGTLHQMMASRNQFTEAESGRTKEREKVQASTDPWTAAWTGWLQAFQAGSRENAEIEASKPRKPSPSVSRSSDTDEEMVPWQDMMQKGQEMQMQYLTSLQSVLEDAWKPRKH
ncbi:DUF937 domain-containing protein [Microvirga puerhi]|uniref:DUF937 domain-containing protein n=1 Tax=Microvirga puerhi TaxID=2876078 RepID=A0ABS7VLH8_9HYPH|nr:DUF937 domain-containing protein [Microvirga puerhi]MBZ6076021.1 DUF937 domain-containing protein [Microvirga puerhi]